MKKRLFSGILALTVLLSLLPVFTATANAEESGSTDWVALTEAGKFELNGSYYISTAEELALFRDMINDHPNDSSLYSCTFYLTADIELYPSDAFLYNNKGHISGRKPDAGVEKWIPIGKSYEAPFKGTFDGQGHTISGLYCHVPKDFSSGKEGHAGLFGYLWLGSAVRNVHVANAYVYDADGNAGGIAAGASTASITDCSFEGHVFAGGSGGAAHSAGGIVGRQNGGKIDGCTVDASVAAYSAGGIVGTVTNSGAVANCLTVGEAVTTSSNSYSVAGGIVGEAGAMSVIRNCGSTMDIFSPFGSGIAGHAGFSGNVTIENCWFAGEFTGSATANPKLAGIAVVMDNYKDYVSIDHCYAAYRSANNLFRLESALQKPDQGENGGGLFDDQLTVITTTSDGFSAYWEKDEEGHATEFCHVGDTPYALSGRTKLTVALNAWVAEQNRSGESCHFWTVGSDGLPQFLRDDWSDAADSRLDLSDDTIYIRSAAELAQLAVAVNSGNTLSGKQVVLCNAIDLSGKRWTPIGSDSVSFDGSFDGQGYPISGMLVDSGASCTGLFGSAGGTLKNIQLVDAFVYGTLNSGGITGRADASVDSCSFSGAVCGDDRSGGIAGTVSTTITNCRNDGIVSGSIQTGAVVGNVDGSAGNCFSSGAVYGGASTFRMRTVTVSGNIVGSGTADNCYDSAAVTGDSEALLAELSAAAAENPAYTDWTASSAANKGLPYFAAFSGGEGTAEDPFRITTVEQLSYLGTLVNSGADQSDVCYRLDADLTLNDGFFDANGIWFCSSGEAQPTGRSPILWTPIGTESNSFAGSFDGAGHVIYGLYCDGFGGLFGDLGGSVRNLLLAEGYFAEGESAVAGSNCGSIRNCGSSCTGSGGSLDGENCWDLENMPSLNRLNSWVTAHGSDYQRWYAAPGKDTLSFRPTLIPITYTLGGGENTDDLTHYIYGEDLSAPAAPTRKGYSFAGWSVYVNATSDGAMPVDSFVMGGSSIDVSNAESLRLEALWAEEGKTLFDYCTFVDGIYVLNSDVLLAEPAVFTTDTVLDLNGHTLQGYGETALLMANSCSLRICSSGSDGEIHSNAAAAGGIGGQVITPGMAPMDRVFFVYSDVQEFLLTAYTPVKGSSGTAYLATYNEFGQMQSIEAVSDAPTEEFSLMLTAEELSAAARIRCFILPSCWLNR